MAALPFLPEKGWHLDITGSGKLENKVRQFADDPKWKERVKFHGVLEEDAFQKLVAEMHVGLNCQLSSDPISSVTFPSKIFSYLSAGLVVLSSTASEVPAICGNACIYFDQENEVALAKKMALLVQDFEGTRNQVDSISAAGKYSVNGTANRLKILIESILK